MAHIAIVRSSARMAQQKANESQQSLAMNSSAHSNPDHHLINEQFSQLSVISVSSSEGGDMAHETEIRRLRTKRGSGSTTSNKSSPVKAYSKQRPMTAPLDRLATFSDIEACLNSDLSQIEVLNRLEEQWRSINSNFEVVLNHLKECSDQVTQASNDCLQSLVDSIETTCDSVDGQVKALYHLMTRCDELTTKLSAAGSFRDDIKTLRKSVDTLENLYRYRPHASVRRPTNQTINS